MKKHFQGCPGSYNQISDIPVYCNCPESNDYYPPTYGPGSIGYVAPVDRTPEIIELLKEILYSLKQLQGTGGAVPM